MRLNTFSKIKCLAGSLLFVLTTTIGPTVRAISVNDLQDIVNGHSNYSPRDEANDNACSGQTSPFGQSAALSLYYPGYSDESSIATKLENYIRDDWPDSPWLTVANLGQRIIEEAKEANANPLIMMAIGQQESHFSTDNSTAVSQNNPFGIKAGSEYKSFPTVEAGLFDEKSIIPGMPDRLANHPNYKMVTNVYEYLSVHVSGQIIYRGDSTQVYDEIMDETVNYQNVEIYFATYMGVYNSINNTNIPSTPPTRGTNIGQGGGYCSISGLSAGVNGWGLPGESNPMIYYSQLTKASSPQDPAVTDYFGQYPYGTGTIAGCGCGPTSFAMIVATLTGRDVKPPEVAEWANSNGYQQSGECGGSSWWWTEDQSAEKWGVTARQISIDEAPAELRAGRLIIASVGPGSVFLSDGGEGHLLVMRAVTDDGKFLFADPSDSNSKRARDIFKDLGSSHTPVDKNTVQDGLKALFVVEKAAIEVNSSTGGLRRP